MRGPLKIICATLCFGLAIGACGGASDTPPGPLAKHFDDMYIAAIPLDQKQSVVQTQNDWNIARMENAKGESDFNEATTQLQIAHNDQKATRLAIDSAVSTKQSADKSADQNKINQAIKDLHTAQDLGKASDARVRYLELYRAYVKRSWRVSQETMYWRESQYEAAKAQVAQKNNIAPRGVTYDVFPKQLDERQKRTQSSKEKAEGEKQRAISARENWLKMQHQADTENGGHETQSWDPMAPKSGPATAGNVTSQPMDNSAPNP